MKRNVSPSVAVLVVAVVVIILALWYHIGTRSGPQGSTAVKMGKAGNVTPSVDTKGKLTMKEVPEGVPEAAKKGTPLQLPGK